MTTSAGGDDPQVEGSAGGDGPEVNEGRIARIGGHLGAISTGRRFGNFLTRAIDLTFDEDLQIRRRRIAKRLVDELGDKAPRAIEIDYLDWIGGSYLIDDDGREERKKHIEDVGTDPTYNTDTEGRTLALLAVISKHGDARYLKRRRISAIIDTGKRI